MEYLPNLLDSILSQNYDRWEAIVVDDGSTDNTADVVVSYSSKDERIKLIQQANKGVCCARNTGLSNSDGEWIWFVDSDDEIMPDAMKYMAEAAMVANCDILYADYQISPSPQHNKRAEISLSSSINCEKAVELLFGSEYGRFWGYLWCKLFRRSIIIQNKIHFREGLYFNEDSLFIFEFLSLTDRGCNVIKYPVYRYYFRQNSTMTQIESRLYWKYESDLDACLIMIGIAKRFSLHIQELVRYRTIGSYKRNKQLIARYGNNDRIANKRLYSKLKSVISVKQMLSFELRRYSTALFNRITKQFCRIK